MAITFIVIATVFNAGCIGEDVFSNSSQNKTNNEFDTSVYTLVDEVKDTDDQTIVSKTLSFTYEGKIYTVNVNVPQYRLNNYKANTYKLHDYQRGFAKDVYLEDVIQQLTNQANTNDRQELAKFLISFVQNAISYETDMNAHSQSDYWAYPVETLIYGGDCDCKATLMTAVLRTAGYDAITLLQDIHLATLVSDIRPYTGMYTPNSNSYNFDVMLSYNDKEYYVVDATGIYGVGCYSKELTERLNEYYTIYDQTEGNVYIDGEWYQKVVYKK